MKEILIAGLILVFGLWLTIFSFNEYRSYAKLDTQGIDVMSEPLEKYTERTKGGITVGYDISPSFHTQSGGGSHTCNGSVDKGIIDRLQGLPIIKIRYLPSDPSVCLVEGAEKNGDFWAMLIGFAIIIGSALSIYNRSTLR